MAVYKCILCGNTYDESKGEPYNNIPAGTLFEELPATYTCPLCCEDPKLYYKKVEEIKE